MAVVLSGLFTFVIVVFPLVTLVFPDGRLPSPGWRWVVYAYLGLSLILPVSYVAATASALTGHHLVYLASGEVASRDAPPSWTELVFFGTVGLAWLGALGHQVASWRRSSGERRQQLKWLLSGTMVCAVLGIWALATNSAIWEVAILGLCALPASMGVAILAAFAGRLQDALDLDAVRADLLGSVMGALEPAHVSVWLDRDRR